MRWTTERSLTRWLEKGLLTADKVAELRADLAEGSPHRGIRIFGALGAVLVGLGVILFVSSHWDTMGPWTRLGVLVAGYGTVVTGAVFMTRRDLPRVAEALWLVSTFVLGANIFLIAQIFHFRLTYWQGTLQWMLGALILGWALRSRLQAAIAVPLGLLTLGWLGSGGGWVFDDQFEFLFVDAGLRPIFPLVGVGLICLSLFASQSRSWQFAQGSCLGWGLVLIMVSAVISTTDAQVAQWFFGFDGTPTQIMILGGVAALLGATMALGRFQWPGSKLLLGAIAALSAVALLRVDGRSWLSMTGGDFNLAFAGYILVVFALTLWTLWTGVKASHITLINVGMVTSALLILTQYFSWSFALLDRSMAFILGGLVLLGLSVVLEKKRRSLVEKIRPAGGRLS